MGSTLSAEERANRKKERAAEKEINREMKFAETNDSFISKLLLLGTGSCGKSTIFKQLVGLYADGYSTEERLSFKSVIYENVISSMKQLILVCKKLPEEKYRICKENFDSVRFIENLLEEKKNFTAETIQHVKRLWADPAVNEAFKMRGEFHILDTASFFFDRIEDYTADYVPSMDDITHCRLRTTGINEKSFTVEDSTFFIIDVGGQRNERSKWIHCFDGVTSLVFIAALNEFDQTLYEDVSINAMKEALDVFENTLSLETFRNIPVIFFLNKCDLLREKVETCDISKHFADFDGDPRDYKDVLNFIKRMFLKRRPSGKQIYTHVTCATDTKNVEFTFKAVSSIILSQEMDTVGMFAV